MKRIVLGIMSHLMEQDNAQCIAWAIIIKLTSLMYTVFDASPRTGRT